MLHFQKTARQVRAFYEGDTDIEILGKTIDGLYQQITTVKETNKTIETYL
jgi:hypothetical protein